MLSGWRFYRYVQYECSAVWEIYSLKRFPHYIDKNHKLVVILKGKGHVTPVLKLSEQIKQQIASSR